MTNEMRGEIKGEAALDYILAGNATVTLVNKETGGRFTYKVQTPKDFDPNRPVHFVKVLNGQDNTGDFAFLGTIFNKADYRHGKKSYIGIGAPSAVAFSYVWGELLIGTLPESVAIFHEGACGRCGRALTVPESVTSGYGPDCAAMLGIDQDGISTKRGGKVAPADYTPAPTPAPAPVAPARHLAPQLDPVTAKKRDLLAQCLQALGESVGVSEAVAKAALHAFDVEHLGKLSAGVTVYAPPPPPAPVVHPDLEEGAEFGRREAAQEAEAFLSDPDARPEVDGPSAGIAPVQRVWSHTPVRRKSVKLNKSAGKALEMLRKENEGWLAELAMSDEEYAVLQASRAAQG